MNTVTMGCCKFPFLIRKKKRHKRRTVVSINLVSMVIIVGLHGTIPLATRLLVLLSTVHMYCMTIGLLSSVLNSVLFRPEWQKFSVPVLSPVQRTPLFCFAPNAGLFRSEPAFWVRFQCSGRDKHSGPKWFVATVSLTTTSMLEWRRKTKRI